MTMQKFAYRQVIALLHYIFGYIAGFLLPINNNNNALAYPSQNQRRQEPAAKAAPKADPKAAPKADPKEAPKADPKAPAPKADPKAAAPKADPKAAAPPAPAPAELPPAAPTGKEIGDAKGGTWTILPTLTGVNAMHMFVARPGQYVFVDRPETNPLLRTNGQPAESSLLDLDKDTLTALDITSDTFCSAGSWLGNGTLVGTGGDTGDPPFVPGQQTLRFYDPMTATWEEKLMVMPSKRWYPTMLPLVDGKVLILGGSIGGTGLNKVELNNPTYNIWPPSTADGTPDPDRPIQFLVDTLPYNLYVFLHIVPNAENKNMLFILSNQQPVLFDLEANNVVYSYPKIAVQRTYPQTGTSVMLPLYSNNNYKPEVMVCGGQATYEITATADSSCGRLDLSAKSPAWEMDDFGGIPRVMPDSVILPNGQIVFLNGAQIGYAGFRKGKKNNPLWLSDNPSFNPVLYDPVGKVYTKMNPSTVARMYHSVATLSPDGYVFVAGSNPQASVAKGIKYSTEYRAEIFKPPYLLTDVPRPTILSLNGTNIAGNRITIGYNQPIVFVVSLTDPNPSFTAAIMHLGFVTHSQSMGHRFVGLDISQANFDAGATNQYIVTLTTPPNPTIIAPGPHYIYILNNGAPCVRAAEVLLN
ncbi:galactose oxidase [Rhizophagus irregularis]|uniref:Galactose oxidase n=1 Tax=Rhizophagus irregularis TaxID=588596 RepID=A0A2N0S3L5_9GLOM|nr:galactose oxidase [Rhizophagus irregularis]